MKTTSSNQENGRLWQEFIEYMESIYFAGAIEILPNDVVVFHYEQFKEIVA